MQSIETVGSPSNLRDAWQTCGCTGAQLIVPHLGNAAGVTALIPFEISAYESIFKDKRVQQGKYNDSFS
jgi:hypothetical protein